MTENNASVFQLPPYEAAINEEYWLALNPGLHIDTSNLPKIKSVHVTDEIRSSLLDGLRTDGYFALDQIFDHPLMDELASAVERVKQAGWPTPFAMMYLEYWQLCLPIAEILKTVLGDEFKLVPEFWCWQTDKNQASKGIYPQRARTATSTIAEDGLPKTLRLWIPLTDTTTANGCLYVLPARFDDNYYRNLHEHNVANLQDIKALPLRKGSVLLSSEALLHWGSRGSQTALYQSMALTFTFQRGDIRPYQTPLITPNQLPEFQDRLGLIAQNVNRLRPEANLNPALVPVCNMLANLSEPLHDTNGFEREILEVDVPLSKSRIWDLVQEEREARVLAALDEPLSVALSRAQAVDNHAEMLIAYFLDSKNKLDFTQPINILEIGGESGLFACKLLYTLKSRLKHFADLKNVQIKYWLTEKSELIVREWSKVKALQELSESGLLEFVVLDLPTSKELTSISSGKKLNGEQLQNPLIVISNQSLTSMKQDAFKMDTSSVHEVRFTAYRDERDSKLNRPAKLSELRSTERLFERRALYFENAEFNQLLTEFGATHNQGFLLFPTEILLALSNLFSLTQNKMCLFMTSDAMPATDNALESNLFDLIFRSEVRGLPCETLDIITRYLELHGGSTVFSAKGFNGTATTFSTIPHQTSSAYEHLAKYFEDSAIASPRFVIPKLLDVLVENLRHQDNANTALNLFVSILQSSCFEPAVLVRAYDALNQHVRSELIKLDADRKSYLAKSLEETFQNIFVINNASFKALGAILQFYVLLNLNDECLDICDQAIKRFGSLPVILDHLAVCHENKNNVELARNFFRQTLEQNPNHQWAKEGLERTTLKLQRAQKMTRIK